MTKTAKEILLSLGYESMELGVDNSRKGYVYEPIDKATDQALKELEAIIKSAKPADAYDVPYTDYPAGFNLAIDEYETNLLAALYGEK